MIKIRVCYGSHVLADNDIAAVQLVQDNFFRSVNTSGLGFHERINRDKRDFSLKLSSRSARVNMF